jgi:hypothetical protein
VIKEGARLGTGENPEDFYSHKTQVGGIPEVFSPGTRGREREARSKSAQESPRRRVQTRLIGRVGSDGPSSPCPNAPRTWQKEREESPSVPLAESVLEPGCPGSRTFQIEAGEPARIRSEVDRETVLGVVEVHIHVSDIQSRRAREDVDRDRQAAHAKLRR